MSIACKPATFVKLLISCPTGRFHKDEIGRVLDLDSDKYDFKVFLGSCWCPTLFHTGRFQLMERVLYFYKNEVQIIPE